MKISGFIIPFGISTIGFIAYLASVYVNVTFSIILSAILLSQFLYVTYLLLNKNALQNETSSQENCDSPNLPSISIIIPAYKESNIMKHIFGKVEKIRYGPEKIQWILALEPDDIDMIKSLKKVCDVIEEYDGLPTKLSYKKTIIDIAYNKSGIKTKPAALNEALKIARGEIIGIYDAEDIPQADHALIAADLMMKDEDIVVVQFSRVAAVNHNTWLEKGQKVESEIYRELYTKMAQRFGFSPILGSGYYVRKKILEAVGGWHPVHPAEDLDLTYRILKMKKTYKIITIDKPTITQAVAGLRIFLKQRIRWVKGCIISLPKALFGGKRAIHVGMLTSISSLLALLGLIWFFFGFLSNVIMFVTRYTGETPPLISLLANMPLILLLCIYSIMIMRMKKNLSKKEIFFFYVLIGLEVAISLIAAMEAIIAPGKWHKTVHVAYISGTREINIDTSVLNLQILNRLIDFTFSLR